MRHEDIYTNPTGASITVNVQVFGNLVGNALKLAPRVTTVTVGARRDDGAWVFEVGDDGPGIAIEDQPRLFEKFFRVDDAAVEFLLERGFTTDLGARPLKRAVESQLLTPLAMTIVNHQFPAFQRRADQ